MKKKIVFSIIGIGIISILAGCQQMSKAGIKPFTGAKTNEDGTVTNIEAEYPTTNKLDDTLANGINQFTYTMAEQFGSEKDYFFSPYSICCALTLLDNASEGEAQQELENTIGILNTNDWNMQLSYFMQKENTNDTKLFCANSLWFAQDYQFADSAYEKFFPLINFYYSSSMYETDFAGNPDKAKKNINDWISDHTEGMITDFKQSVDPNTTLDIINAVYFYGKWSDPFDEASTSKDIFHGLDGDTTVDMMHKEYTEQRYYAEHGICGVSFCYEGPYRMNVLIPESDGNITDLFNSLSTEEKNDYLHNLMFTNDVEICDLQLPKFKMEYRSSLKQVLKQMGVLKIFENNSFPMLGPDILVTDVMHMAVIEVSEKETKAAAVTEVSLDATSAEPQVLDEIDEFIVDQPFLYFIQDISTEAIIFMGQMNNIKND